MNDSKPEAGAAGPAWTYGKRGYALATSLRQIRLRKFASLSTLLVLGVTLSLPVGDYTKRFIEHSESLESACRRTGADYVKLMTHEPLDSALHAYLQFRKRRGR